MPFASACCGISIFLVILVCPIIFGAIISRLRDDLDDLHDTEVIPGIATRQPISNISCVTRMSSMSTKVTNVLSYRVNGNMSSASEIQYRYASLTPDGKKWCLCERSVDYVIGNATHSSQLEKNINCDDAREYTARNVTVYMYGGINGTIEYASPKQKEDDINQDIGGLFVGIYLCCGMIAFVILGSVLHCMCSRPRDQVSPC